MGYWDSGWIMGHQNPNGTWNPQYTSPWGKDQSWIGAGDVSPSYAPWQAVNKTAAMSGGGGAGAGMGNVPQYPTPVQYDTWNPPALPEVPPLGAAPTMSDPRIGLSDAQAWQLPQPSFNPGADVNVPQMNVPNVMTGLPGGGALNPQVAGMANSLTPSSVGGLNTQLNPGVSLAALNQSLMPYVPTDYSMFGLGQSSPINVPQMLQQQQQQYGGGGGGYAQGGFNPSIQSGVAPPAIPQAPAMPQMGTVSGLGGAGNAGAAATYGQAMQPAYMGMMDQYHQNAAGLGMAGQQAQADSGLGWGSLAALMSQTRDRYNTGMQGNTLGFLGNMSRTLMG